MKKDDCFLVPPRKPKQNNFATCTTNQNMKKCCSRTLKSCLPNLIRMQVILLCK